MKKYLLLLPLLLLASSASAATIGMPSNTLSLSQGLVGYWPLDGATTNWAANTTADRSGQGNTGRLNNIATSTAFATSSGPMSGQIGQAMRFNGSSSYIQTTSSSDFNLQGDFTLAYWQKPYSITETTSRVFNKRPDAALGDPGDGAWVTALSLGKNAYANIAGTTVTGNTTVPANTWSHVIFVRSGNTLSIYYNGVSDGSGTLSGSPSVASSPLRIGIGDDTSRYYPGALDDLRIYNRALSASEVRQLYGLGAARVGASPSTGSGQPAPLSSGLVGHWTLDGNRTNWATGQTLDSSGQGNTGQLTSLSTSTTPVGGKIGQGFRFSGISYVQSTSNIGISGASTRSISAWVKISSCTADPCVIAGWGNTETTGKIFYLVGSLASNFNFGLWGYAQDVTTTIPSRDDKWHFISATYDGTNIRMYVDGVLQNTLASTLDTTASLPVRIGNGQTRDAQALGIVDDVRVYNRTLSANEIKQLYNLGGNKAGTASATGQTSGLVGHWSMDGSSINWTTNTMADKSGQGNTGTLVSLATSTAPVVGKIGQALKFNGSSSKITVTNPSAINSATSITVSGWYNPSETATSNAIVTARNGCVGENINWQLYGHLLVADAGLNGPNFNAYRSGGEVSVNSSTALPTNKWSFVAGTYDGVAAKLYVDGVLVNSVAGTGSLNTNSVDTNIGIDGGCVNWMQGNLDDIRIYNRALSASEVQTLYNSGR